MDLIISRENGVQIYSPFRAIEHSRRGLIESQKDCIFILSPPEWDEWMQSYVEIHRTLGVLETEDEQLQVIMNAIGSMKEEFPMITPMNLLSMFGKLEACICLPGNYYAVFFVQGEQVKEKMAKVAATVLQYEKEQDGGESPTYQDITSSLN